MGPHPSFRPFLHFVWNHSVFYKNLYSSHGIRECDLADITIHDLPVVTKEMIVANFNDVVTDSRINEADLEAWLSVDNDPRSRFLGEFLVLHSTGSSGKQANIVYDEMGWQSMAAAAAAYLYPSNLPADTRYRNAFFIGDRGHVASATTAANLASAAFETLIVSLKDPIENTIAKLNAFQPDRLTSYSSSLGWLAELAQVGGLKIVPKDVVASADRLTSYHERLIRQAWNPRIYDLYAATESLYIAIKGPGEVEWKIMDEIQTIEVLNDDNCQVEPGEMGRSVLTLYTNRIMPLIRYDLKDYVICGGTQLGNSTLRGFISRTFENLPIRLENGRTGEIPGYALAKFDAYGLDSYQFITSNPDTIVLEYCAREPLDEFLRDRMAELLSQWGGMPTRFIVRRVEHIWDDFFALKFKMVRKEGDRQLAPSPRTPVAASSSEINVQLSPASGFIPFGRENLRESIAALFKRQVERTPHSLALTDSEVCLTYQELNQAADRVMQAVLACDLQPAAPVALLFSHKASMIIAMLGVIKAGGWYAPLDPGSLAEKNRILLEEIGAAIILTDDESLSVARSSGFAEDHILNLDHLADSAVKFPPACPHTPASPVCLLFTSGTTGRPKGIALDQHAVLHRVMLYTNDYAVGPLDQVALLQSFVFSASVRDIYSALLNGATLHIYSLKREGVHHLKKWLEIKRISVLYMVPAVFRAFVNTLQGEKFPHLRIIRLGGDMVYPQDVNRFQQYFSPGCILANGLASTETGTICQDFINHQTPIGSGHVPVGFPVQDKIVWVEDDQGCGARDGETGEVVVSSEFFGVGNYPIVGSKNVSTDTTQPGTKRIIRTGDLGYRLPDGRFILVGRKDWLVKLRGQRVNLLEIEQALRSMEEIGEAAVICQTSENGDDFLAAFIRTVDAQPDEIALRKKLRKFIPQFMIPSVFVFCDEMPHTISGKVDRQALQKGFIPISPTCRKSLEQPATKTEIALAEIWREVLQVGEIGLEDNFFDLGGDSLKASTMMAHLETRIQRKYPLWKLFQYHTLRELAAAIDDRQKAENNGLLFSIQPYGDAKPLFFFPGIDGDVLTGRTLSAHLAGRHPIYGFKGIDYKNLDGTILSMEQAAECYEKAIKDAGLEGPCVLIGYSFGGHLALETARRMTISGGQQPMVVLIDTFPAKPLRSPTLGKRIRFHYQNIRGLHGKGEAINYFRNRLHHIYLRLIRHNWTKKIAQKVPPPEDTPISSALIALACYKPQPYGGPLVLIQAGHREWHINGDPMQAWEEMAIGKFTTRTIPGEHVQLMIEPYVSELARQLLDSID